MIFVGRSFFHGASVPRRLGFEDPGVERTLRQNMHTPQVGFGWGKPLISHMV